MFLNETGGGVVTRVIDEQIVHVAVEDGFEIPYSVGDLIRAGGPEGEGAQPQRQKPGTADENNRKTSPLLTTGGPAEQPESGISLAMVPRDQADPLSGSMDFYLLNTTAYHALFGLFLNKGGKYSGLESGSLAPGNKLHLGKADRTEIGDWAHALLQVVFFREGKAEVLPPASEHIVFKQVRVYKEESFAFHRLLQQKAMVVNAVTTAELGHKSKANTESHLVAGMTDSENTGRGLQGGLAEQPTWASGFLGRHKVDENVAEIDLHISSLTDNIRGLSNTDMLTMQLDYARESLRQARKDKVRKLIFIHGVGNGTLKNELLGLLRQRQDIEFYDASYARYGTGATEVVFYRHPR